MNLCAITGTPEVEGDHKVLEVHHCIPLHLGGSWNQDNLILLVRWIHKAVHDESIEVDQRYAQAVERLRKIIRVRKAMRKYRKQR